MLLIVDKNEKATNPKVFNTLKKYFSDVIEGNLIAGDINIPLDTGDILAIERKTPNDFLASIADGRIFEQVERMQESAKYAAFIVTGYFTYGERNDICYIVNENNESIQTNWKGSAVRATMTVIQYSGVPLIFCPARRYPDTIAELYNTVNKPDKRQGITKKRIITFPPVDDRVEFLAQLPNVGIKLATSLLEFAGMMDKNADEDGYGTLASALHWLSIMSTIAKSIRPKGWGPEKILGLRKFLGLASNEYIVTPKEVTEEVQTPSGKETVTYIEMNGQRYDHVPF